MKLPHSPLLFPVCLFTAGACLYDISPYSSSLYFFLIFLLLGFTSILYSQKNLKKLQLLLLYLSFFLLGIVYLKAYYERSTTHYLNQNYPPKTIKEIELLRKVSSSSFYNNYIGEINRIGECSTSGNIMIRQYRDSLNYDWTPGTRLVTFEKSKALSKPLNPGQFSYKSYLNNQKIYHQIDLTSKNSLVIKSEDQNLNQKKLNFKTSVFKRIKTSELPSQSQGMIKALLFGERKALDPKIIEDYTHAGVIHLLALSGLHIGLLMGFLMIILHPLISLKYGKRLRTLIILMVLWLYAYLIDFHPSVSRACTLFSFIIIGKEIAFGRATFHYTVLSFFILLLIYPPFLKSIGFQLSYLAVMGILIIYPLFNTLWTPKHIILKRIWEWTAVCLSAQLAVSPLSLYYFHQFPGLFLLSNLMIIPFFGFYLMFCALVLIVLSIGKLPIILRILFDETTLLLNRSVQWIAEQEAFHFTSVYFSLSTTLLLYCLLLFIILWIYKRKLKILWAVALLVVSLLFNQFIESHTAA